MNTLMKKDSLSTLSLVLTLAVVIVWGVNYVMVKFSLEHMGPLSLCAFRFFLAFFPIIFFIPRPKTSWTNIIAYALLTFAIQFPLLFGGMAAGVAPGVAALIVQSQVFFAIFFACLWTGQSLSPWQVLGGIISFIGIGLIAGHRDLDCSLLGFLLLLGSAILWGLATLVSVRLKAVNMFSMVVWGSCLSFFPLALLAFVFENPLEVLMHANQLPFEAIFSLLYIAYVSTHFGYGVWSWLLSKYETASITPFVLLCPIIAMVSSALLFNETFEPWKIISALFVIAGLCINVFGQGLYQWVLSFRFKIAR